MKTIIKVGLLFIGSIILLSCTKENVKLEQEVTTSNTTEKQKPEVKKITQKDFIGKAFRYGGPETDIKELFQVELYSEYYPKKIMICRRGNTHRLEGSAEIPPYKDGVGTKIGEVCASSYNAETGYFSLDYAPDRIITNSIWLRDIIWLRYNPEKDVLEVKLKTPLAGEGTEPVVYELRRVEKAEYPI